MPPWVVVGALMHNCPAGVEVVQGGKVVVVEGGGGGSVVAKTGTLVVVVTPLPTFEASMLPQAAEMSTIGRTFRVL